MNQMKYSVGVGIFLFFLCLPQTTWAVSYAELTVPFMAQAPHGQWRTQPFADACEETSLLMVEASLQGTKLSVPSVEKGIRDLAAYEQTHFGFHKDTNGIMTARLSAEMLGRTYTIMSNPSLTFIQQTLLNGLPVLAMVYTPALQPAWYRAGKNPYHVLVIKGFNDATQTFITNDPGTNKGDGVEYSYERLLAALHDWTPAPNTGKGTPIILVPARQ